jgi:hypothetical protein
MSIAVNSDQWIFINYAPGSFGSFLTKVLELSPEVAGAKKSEIFNEYNASHLNITHWIQQLHDGDDIDAWANLSFEDQNKCINDQIDLEQFNSTALKKIHRLTVPKYNALFRKHFVHAQFIKITVEPEFILLIATTMADKTIDNWFTNKIEKNNTLKKILSKVSPDQLRAHYIRECTARINDIIDNSIEPATFNFPLTAFFTQTDFCQTVNNLTAWLEINPIDCVELYDQFFKKHNGFIK